MKQEWVVDSKVEGAGQQGKEDSGPHHHHYGGCELCWISEYRCGSSNSKEEGAGQKGVFEEVYIVKVGTFTQNVDISSELFPFRL